MKKIRISDVTMKQDSQMGTAALTFREKIELAKILDRLGVSVIELEGIAQPKIDALRIKSIAAVVKQAVVAVPVDLCEEGVAAVWAALAEAQHPRLQVFAPVSPMQMEYLFHKKAPDMLTGIQNTVQACRALTEDVEFIAGDATRSDPEFLYQAVAAAIKAGAGIITLCDTAGAMLPDEFTEFLDSLYENVPDLEKITLGVSCADDLAMADACAIAAVRRGAGEVKTAAFPMNTISLVNLTKLLATKEDVCGARSDVRITEINRSLNQIAWMFQSGRSKHSPFDSGVREDEQLDLTAHDDITAVDKAIKDLGYDLSSEDTQRVWEAFQTVVAHKEKVSAKELDALVASAAMQAPDTYKLENYAINISNVLGATAHIKLVCRDEVLEGLCAGDGPVDAAFLAIEQIVGHHYELDDFQIQAVTEGREAMGETVVKLRSNGKLYSGQGLSTDIVCSSLMAYINALNKIVYEEEMV